MSDAQRTLDAFQRLKRTRVIDDRHWQPGNGNRHGARRCRNCGSQVTERYVRVSFPDGIYHPPACPFCIDKIVLEGEVRERRSHTSRGGS